MITEIVILARKDTSHPSLLGIVYYCLLYIIYIVVPMIQEMRFSMGGFTDYLRFTVLFTYPPQIIVT